MITLRTCLTSKITKFREPTIARELSALALNKVADGFADRAWDFPVTSHQCCVPDTQGD